MIHGYAGTGRESKTLPLMTLITLIFAESKQGIYLTSAKGATEEKGKTYHGVVMTEEVPNECENVFCCRSACGSAPAYGSEVLV